MERVSRIFWPLAFAFCLAAVGPAGALPATVFWDGPDLGDGDGPGKGVSAATASSASAAGVPIVQPAGFQHLPVDPEDPELAIDQALDGSTLATFGDPITSLTITSTWTVNNGFGVDLQNLYLVFEQPLANGGVVYDPSDVGLTLGANWVILQTVAGATPLYYPAISLGNLANDANAALSLFYTLHHPPQEFSSQNRNLELGMPQWSLFYVSAPIPEPASGLLVLFGLLGIAGGRRKRS